MILAWASPFNIIYNCVIYFIHNNLFYSIAEYRVGYFVFAA